MDGLGITPNQYNGGKHEEQIVQEDKHENQMEGFKREFWKTQ